MCYQYQSNRSKWLGRKYNILYGTRIIQLDSTECFSIDNRLTRPFVRQRNTTKYPHPLPRIYIVSYFTASRSIRFTVYTRKQNRSPDNKKQWTFRFHFVFFQLTSFFPIVKSIQIRFKFYWCLIDALTLAIIRSARRTCHCAGPGYIIHHTYST